MLVILIDWRLEMRQIKFRAWNDIDKKMCDNGVVTRILSALLTSKNYHVMQFTGLTDINGVEIYEGDIVRLWYAPQATAIGFISFENGGFVFNTEKATPKKEFAGTCIDCGNSFTVIGNIYQNTELLK